MKKSHKTFITLLALIAYVWSVTADVLPVGGVLIILLYGLWFLVPTIPQPEKVDKESWILKKINEAAGVSQTNTVSEMNVVKKDISV